MQSKNLLPFSASIKNHYNGTKSRRRRRLVVSQSVYTKVGRRHSAASLALSSGFFLIIQQYTTYRERSRSLYSCLHHSWQKKSFNNKNALASIIMVTGYYYTSLSNSILLLLLCTLMHAIAYHCKWKRMLNNIFLMEMNQLLYIHTHARHIPEKFYTYFIFKTSLSNIEPCYQF